MTARKAGLGGKVQIALKDYPRLTYAVVIEAKKCVDFRNIASNAVLKDGLAAASGLDDLGLRRKLVLICWTKELKRSAVAQTSLPLCTAIPLPKSRSGIERKFSRRLRT